MGPYCINNSALEKRLVIDRITVRTPLVSPSLYTANPDDQKETSVPVLL